MREDSCTRVCPHTQTAKTHLAMLKDMPGSCSDTNPTNLWKLISPQRTVPATPPNTPARTRTLAPSPPIDARTNAGAHSGAGGAPPYWEAGAAGGAGDASPARGSAAAAVAAAPGPGPAKPAGEPQLRRPLRAGRPEPRRDPLQHRGQRQPLRPAWDPRAPGTRPRGRLLGDPLPSRRPRGTTAPREDVASSPARGTGRAQDGRDTPLGMRRGPRVRAAQS